MTFLKLAPVLLSAFSFSLLAEEQNSNNDAGFLVGGGVFSAANSNCTNCDYSGQAFEVGYDFNNIIGIEAKYATGDDDFDLTVSYVGLNIGHDFNTEWFRLYGKIGYAKVEEEETIYWSGYCNDDGCWEEPHTEKIAYSDSGATFGIGTRFTFSGKASGLYLKLETMAVGFQNDTVGAAIMAGLGYRF